MCIRDSFWITPDESNLDPDAGGLVIWPQSHEPSKDVYDRYAAYDKFAYAQDDAAVFGLTVDPAVVPYRANRAVIFNSAYYHTTDKYTFKDGYANRRINLTLLYGRDFDIKCGHSKTHWDRPRAAAVFNSRLASDVASHARPKAPNANNDHHHPASEL